MHVTIWKKSFRRLLFPPAKEPICCGWMSVRTVLTRGSSRSGCEQQSLILDEGYLFGAQGKGFERINMAAPRSLIEECMRRFVKAVSGEAIE